jgi:hypothetical protein
MMVFRLLPALPATDLRAFIVVGVCFFVGN